MNYVKRVFNTNYYLVRGVGYYIQGRKMGKIFEGDVIELSGDHPVVFKLDYNRTTLPAIPKNEAHYFLLTLSSDNFFNLLFRNSLEIRNVRKSEFDHPVVGREEKLAVHLTPFRIMGLIVSFLSIIGLIIYSIGGTGILQNDRDFIFLVSILLLIGVGNLAWNIKTVARESFLIRMVLQLTQLLFLFAYIFVSVRLKSILIPVLLLSTVLLLYEHFVRRL